MVAASAKPGARAVVIGGGLLGLEAAYGLARRGMAATVVHLMDVLMERQLDESGRLPAARGPGGTRRRDGAGRPFRGDRRRGRPGRRPEAEGRPHPAVRPAGHGRGHPPECRPWPATPAWRSIAAWSSTTPCAPPTRRCSPWANAPSTGATATAWSRPSGRCAARWPRSMTDGEGAYEGSVLSTRLKVSGVDVFSAGKFSGGEGCEDIVFRDAGRGVYKRVVIEDGKVAGAVLFGDAVDGNWYFDLMRARDLGHRHPRDPRSSARPSRKGCPAWTLTPAVAAMPDTARRSAAATASARVRSSRPSPPRA